MTWTDVIKTTAFINLGAFFIHLVFGNPYAAVGHFLLGTLAVIFLGGSSDRNA